MRSPGPTPSAVNPAASCPTCSLSWVYVVAFPMNQTAVLRGCVATAWLNRLTRMPVPVPVSGCGSVRSFAALRTPGPSFMLCRDMQTGDVWGKP